MNSKMKPGFMLWSFERIWRSCQPTVGIWLKAAAQIWRKKNLGGSQHCLPFNRELPEIPFALHYWMDTAGRQSGFAGPEVKCINTTRLHVLG